MYRIRLVFVLRVFTALGHVLGISNLSCDFIYNIILILKTSIIVIYNYKIIYYIIIYD